jgi:hypothetical protein
MCRAWIEGLLRWPRWEVVCRGSCPAMIVCGLIRRKASITTLPLTDWIGSITTATERAFSASKLCVHPTLHPPGQQGTHVHAHAYTRTHAHTRTHTRAHTHAHTRIRTHTHTHAYTHGNTRVSLCRRTYTPTCRQTPASIVSCACTSMHCRASVSLPRSLLVYLLRIDVDARQPAAEARVRVVPSDNHLGPAPAKPSSQRTVPHTHAQPRSLCACVYASLLPHRGPLSTL